MPTWAWVLVIVVLLSLAAAVLLARRRSRRPDTAALRQRFGPEYERAVAERGNRVKAERELADIAEKRDRLDVRPLSAESRARHAARWERVQAAFVDQPHRAVREADALIAEVMHERGYPVDDMHERTSLVSIDHPDVVQHYRAAYEVTSRGGGATTEDLRQAFVHYRALFDRMLVDDVGPGAEPPAGAETTELRSEPGRHGRHDGEAPPVR